MYKYELVLNRIRKLMDKKQLLALVLSMFFIISYSQITVFATELPSDYNKIAETSKLALYYNQKENSVVVQNLVNGFRWNSAVTEEQYDIASLNAQWKANVKALFNINYTNFKNNDGLILASNSVEQKPDITVKNIKNGVSLNYDFKTLKISFTVALTIGDNYFNVLIPADSIKEQGNFGLVSIEMLPFFGAVKDKQDGYIFYPDGSGALMNLDDISHVGAKPKSWSVFSPDLINYMIDKDSVAALMPVFGVKQSVNGFLAIINEGEEDASINLTPSGNVVNLNRICSEFIYRRSYTDPRIKKTIAKKFTRDMSNVNHSIRYIILSGSDASYSGMANQYRDYLIKGEKINKHISNGDKIPLGIDLFMGVNEKLFLFNKFIPMTTFSEAESILESFKSIGVDSMQTNLIGWTKEGYGTPPLQFPPNKKLGGESGLKNLANYAKNNNVKLYLQTNLIDAISENGGFSKRNDVAFQPSGVPFTDFLKERFILNPFVIRSNFIEKLLPQAKKYGIGGVSSQGLGKFIYSDYNKKHPTTLAQTLEYWKEIMDNSYKELGGTAADGGNAYLLKCADRLLQIPDKDTGYFITSDSIPFYQMVVHGLLPYSSTPGNLSHDFSREKLKWVEYGYIPYFELTYQSPVLLKHTNYNKLFTSSYKDWVETASEVYKEFNQRLGDVWSQYITGHEKLLEDVYRVTYENGTQVYINYRQQSLYINGYSIKALDYLVVEKGGKTK
jgi:hypothetical protein